MIHEDITISGSFQASGSFILPRIPSNSLATATTGSMFYDTVNDVVKIYTGTGSTTDGYITVGAQSEPAAAAAASEDIEYLLVAGGGGGGFGSGGGGGGAGGLLSSSLSDVASGSTFTITIGAGGSGGIDSSQTAPNGGSDSSIAGSTISTLTATGGGEGGNESANAGQDGGSGGGGSFNRDPGSGTVGQGTDGGDGFQDGTHYAGGGGGGAGAAGGNASNSTAGLGGIGKLSHITGTGSYYAGGGSGEFQDTADGNTQTFAGGLGGGGAGGNYRGGSSATPAEDGDPHTGGGGGGGTNSGTGFNGVGGNGGSGVAIFSYPTSSITATGGTKTSTADGEFVHTFKNSGTLTVGGSSFNTVAPGDHFNIIQYSGNNTTNSIKGVGFKPDLFWLKGRTFSDNHNVGDSNRGAQKLIFPNLDSQQFTSANYFTSFDADGFTLGSENTANKAQQDFIAYCWKVNGGTTSSNTDGTVTSTVQANTAAGISIATATGNGSTTTFGHGLGDTPELIIRKRLDSALDWTVYFTVLDGSLDYMNLNLTSAKDNSGYSLPTSTTFTIPSAGDWVFYCFKSVTGISKIGTYTGNGSAGKSITTGFRPGFILIKSTVGADNWRLYDTVRGITNGGYLEPNRSDADDTSNAPNLTITDTGFEITAGGTTVGNNADGNDYLYWAIAN